MALWFPRRLALVLLALVLVVLASSLSLVSVTFGPRTTPEHLHSALRAAAVPPSTSRTSTSNAPSNTSPMGHAHQNSHVHPAAHVAPSPAAPAPAAAPAAANASVSTPSMQPSPSSPLPATSTPNLASSKPSSPFTAAERKQNHDLLGMVVLNTPPGYPLWGHLSVQNKQAYADRHGYGLHFQTTVLDETRHPAWSKIIAMQNLMRQGQHKWLWSLDMDTIITNHSKKIGDLVDDKYDIIISHDCNAYNTGSFLIKASNWSLGFLENVYKRKDAQPAAWWENAAVIEEFEAIGDLKFRKHVKVVPQRQLNSYLPSICHFTEVSSWVAGDLLLHFPGLRNIANGHQIVLDYFNRTANALSD
ncbi:hypothetical protein BC831DRAFT_505045 [Entophlyctis helioformis]|nr:hypothetical protein BC831DRAFT_505045 [Entophlyctis helioformis]